jgi:threonine dehydratase
MDLAQRIRDTAAAIRPFVRHTPLMDATGIAAPHAQLFLKLELMQHAGSFKTRGAFANLLTRTVPADGVVAASGGNHGAAIAYAAQRLGIPATIFVPEISSPAKMDRIRSYGAKLVVTGKVYADALAASEEWSSSRNVLRAHAYDDIETIIGQGTLALELEEELPQVDTVLAAVGGGGLLAGIAAWFGKRVRVIAVEPQGAPTLERALAAGEPVDAEMGSVAADSLAPRRIGTNTFAIIQPVLAESVLVSDDDIRAAQKHLWNSMRVVGEPGGVTAFSAVLSGAYKPQRGERVAVVVSGGNTTAVSFE